MSNENEKILELIEKVRSISREYQLLTRTNLSFEELNQFNEQVHGLAILISQDLEILTKI